MARYLSPRFEYQDHVYQFEFGIDQIAALRENLTIEITARSYSIKDERAEAVTVSLTLDIGRGDIVIEVEGEEVGRVSLNELPVAQADAADIENAEDAARDAWAVLVEYMFGDDGPATGFETVMAHIPVTDPFLGCLLKGVISASVGQTIRCYQRLTPAEESLRQKLQFIAKCLGNKVWGIFGRAAYRSARCMASGGLGG